MSYHALRDADRHAREADRVERSRDIAKRELRYRLALQGRSPTPAELQAAADDAEQRERQGDGEKSNDDE